MNELEQLKAKKAGLETELLRVKSRINQIKTDEFCEKWGVKVGDFVEFTDPWSTKKGKIEGVVYGLAFEVRLLRKNGELGKKTTSVWPTLHQIKKLN